MVDNRVPVYAIWGRHICDFCSSGSEYRYEDRDTGALKYTKGKIFSSQYRINEMVKRYTNLSQEYMVEIREDIRDWL